MIEFRDALTDLLEEFGANDGWYVTITYILDMGTKLNRNLQLQL